MACKRSGVRSPLAPPILTFLIKGVVSFILIVVLSLFVISQSANAKKTEKKWGTPISLQLAIIKMESDFDWLAKPKRQKIFKVIPYKRPSSSFGYSQAVKGTWEQYKRETNNPLATRARFKDSVDFIGWYIHKTNKILKISKKDPYRQYLAYYKGWGDYKNYSKDKKAIIYAKSVKDMASKYRKQLTLCKKNLDKNKYIIF